ncbi:Kiwa anti-phage protein KwaB-like domain-containing protein [Geobacillus stearothermophilus]|uniref:Kiwa anti-phage protein KwaB-like domain-containing protein n=1 Tax=Geobacillus stearothermophilus TaxID=1422 RepID=UPI003D1D841F
MDVRRLCELLMEDNTLDIRLYFTRKKQNGTYISYSPSISKDLQEELKEIVTSALDNISTLEQREFNPIGMLDGYIETYNPKHVSGFDDIVRSMHEEIVYRGSISSDEINKLNFYCIKYHLDQEWGDVLFFRRVTKFKKLRKGIVGRFVSNDFEKIDNDLLGIDPNIDIVVFNGEMLIINHVAFERIFRIHDQYLEKAQETLNKIKEAKKISNFEQFEEDCLSDARITRALTKLLSEEERIDKFILNFENVRTVIEIFELDVRVENGVLIYEDKSQLMDIVRLIRDSYYESLIANRKGIDVGL